MHNFLYLCVIALFLIFDIMSITSEKIKRRKQLVNAVINRNNFMIQKEWNDLMMETLGLSDNLMQIYGISYSLWRIILNYLEIKFDDILEGINGKHITICNCYGLSFHFKCGNFTYSMCHQHLSKNIGLDDKYIEDVLLRQIGFTSNIMSIRLDISECPISFQNSMSWLGVLDFDMLIIYGGHDYEMFKLSR